MIHFISMTSTKIAQSPDLSACDFWLWGYVRNDLYKSPRPSTPLNLKQRLEYLMNNIPKRMIQSSYSSFLRRCELCVELNGSHFKQNL